MSKRPVIINEIAGLDASQGVYEISKEDAKKIKKNKSSNILSESERDKKKTP